MHAFPGFHPRQHPRTCVERPIDFRCSIPHFTANIDMDVGQPDFIPGPKEKRSNICCPPTTPPIPDRVDYIPSQLTCWSFLFHRPPITLPFDVLSPRIAGGTKRSATNALSFPVFTYFPKTSIYRSPHLHLSPFYTNKIQHHLSFPTTSLPPPHITLPSNTAIPRLKKTRPTAAFS